MMNDYTGFTGLANAEGHAAAHRALVRELLQGGLTGDELLRRSMARQAAVHSAVMWSCPAYREAQAERMRLLRQDETFQACLREGQLRAAHKRRRLSDEQVREAWAMRREGYPTSAIARHFGLHSSSIYQIFRGECYADVVVEDGAA